MTAQIGDEVAYAGADWTLAGVNGGELFDPASYGLRVRPASTACWRGFVCRYELRDSALYLDGTKIDFYDGLEKRGFTFENPNAVKSCGCGSSFSA